MTTGGGHIYEREPLWLVAEWPDGDAKPSKDRLTLTILRDVPFQAGITTRLAIPHFLTRWLPQCLLCYQQHPTSLYGEITHAA